MKTKAEMMAALRKRRKADNLTEWRAWVTAAERAALDAALAKMRVESCQTP
jgi:hypothetical protein